MMGHVPDFDQTRWQIRLTENMTEDILQSEPVEFELVQRLWLCVNRRGLYEKWGGSLLGVKDMIRYLRENNISLSRVHCIMGSMFGSMEAVPFNQESLRAVCAEIARDHKDDDVMKTLEVFREMRAEDPGFQFSVDLDEEKKIKTLLWTSGRCRAQYSFFGDAITFDSTYCTNLYKMPFAITVPFHHII